MRAIFNILVFVWLIVFLTSCNRSNNSTTSNSSIEVKTDPGPPTPCEDRSTPLNIVNERDTLKILIEFSDCGEWGGHKENIFLQRNKHNKLFARFIQDSVSCNNLKVAHGFSHLDDGKRVTVFDTTKFLSIEDEKLINSFLQRLTDLYLRSYISANAGMVYRVINTDSTMNFTYWNSGDCRDTYYGKVRKQIFGVDKIYKR